MGALRIGLVVFAGLISAPLTDVASVIWMRLAPASLDLTGSYFLSVVLPAVLAIHLLMALVLWKAFEPNPTRNPALFVGSHTSAQMAMLGALANPLSDIITAAAIILTSGTLVMALFRHYFWCAHCSALE